MNITHTTQNFTILIVDDEETVSLSLKKLLEKEGFKTMTASCGIEAFEVIEKNPIDIVISDIKMPNGNGLELIQKIQEGQEHNGKSPHIIVLTGFIGIHQKEKLKMGVYEIFNKPVSSKRLLSKIKTALNLAI